MKIDILELLQALNYLSDNFVIYLYENGKVVGFIVIRKGGYVYARYLNLLNYEALDKIIEEQSKLNCIVEKTNVNIKDDKFASLLDYLIREMVR